VSTARSLLFVPGDRPDRIAKAWAAGADAVIVDLEDAVSASSKAAARDALSAASGAAAPLWVRVNGIDTPWFEDDLAACASAAGRIAGLVLPKAESVDAVQRVASVLGAGCPILALIETAAGFANVQELAGARAVRRLLFGTIDFQLDLGIAADAEELLYFRSRLVLVSRLCGLEPPVDGVTTAIDDPVRVRADAQRARRLGFGGKLCIHPKQIGEVNAAFSPDAQEIAWAERVVAAAASQAGAFAVDGKMIDRPVLLRARATLDAAARITTAKT
jgi:citrate lyase subunit beta / citryl-CoA lyase